LGRKRGSGKRPTGGKRWEAQRGVEIREKLQKPVTKKHTEGTKTRRGAEEKSMQTHRKGAKRGGHAEGRKGAGRVG